MRGIAKYFIDVLVFVVAFIFFLQTLVENFSGPHDAINYLNGIVKGKDLFHQHHLLFHASSHVWFKFWSQIFVNIEPYFIVESFTAFFGALNCWIVYRIFKDKFQVPLLLNIGFLLVIVFTYGFWLYSINVEVYAPPIFFLLCTIYLLGSKQFTKNIVGISIFHSLAILFHQVHVLFIVVVLWKLVSKKAYREIIIYAIIGILLVGSVYLSIGYFVEQKQTLDDLWKWLSGYTNSSFYWQKPGLEMLVKVFTGFTHAYIGGHFIFQLDWIKELLKGYRGHSLADEMYLVRELSSTVSLILTFCSILFAVAFAYFNIRFFKSIPTIKTNRHPIIGPLLITTIVYSIFFCFWMPEILEFWIFQTICIWIILFGTAYVNGLFKKNYNIYFVFITAALLFAINWWGSLKYMQQLDNDLYYVRTQKLMNHLDEKTIAIFQDGWLQKDFIEYFSKAQIVVAPQPDEDFQELNKRIETALQNDFKVLIFPEKNNYGLVQSTQYIDSLLLQNQSRWIIIQNENPKVLLLK